MHDVDDLNSGYARLLLEQYLEDPASVPGEWRELFESGDSEVVAAHPALSRLLEVLQDGNEQRPLLLRRALLPPKCPSRRRRTRPCSAPSLRVPVSCAPSGRTATLQPAWTPWARSRSAIRRSSPSGWSHPSPPSSCRACRPVCCGSTSQANRSRKHFPTSRTPTAEPSRTRPSTSRTTRRDSGCGRRSNPDATGSLCQPLRSATCSKDSRRVEAFERYLRRAFLGQKQFSIEGLDVLVPMLDAALELAAEGERTRQLSAWLTGGA